MSQFQARPGLSIVWMSPRTAEAHVRGTMRIPAHVQLGWTPYTIIVTDGALPHTAFVKAADFRRWLGSLRVKFTESFDGMRIGRVFTKEAC